MSIQDYKEMKLAQLRAHLAEGEAQTKRGESTMISNQQELHEFLDDIKTQNREKIDR